MCGQSKYLSQLSGRIGARSAWRSFQAATEKEAATRRATDAQVLEDAERRPGGADPPTCGG